MWWYRLQLFWLDFRSDLVLAGICFNYARVVRRVEPDLNVCQRIDRVRDLLGRANNEARNKLGLGLKPDWKRDHAL